MKVVLATHDTEALRAMCLQLDLDLFISVVKSDLHFNTLLLCVSIHFHKIVYNIYHDIYNLIACPVTYSSNIIKTKIISKVHLLSHQIPLATSKPLKCYGSSTKAKQIKQNKSQRDKSKSKVEICKLVIIILSFL